MKVVLNRKHGGFGIRKDLFQAEFPEYESQYDIPRYHPRLIELIGKMGAMNVEGEWSELHIVEVPQRYFYIREYDGKESLLTSDSPIYNTLGEIVSQEAD